MYKKGLLHLMAVTIVAMLGFSFFSCSNDDDSQIDIADAVGTWMCVESQDTSNGQTYEGLLVGAQITIRNNGTYTSTSTSFGSSGTYVLNENTITAKNNYGDTFIVKVTIKGNRMTWSGTASTGVNFKYVFARE